MNKPKSFLLLSVISAVLILGVAYAAIADIPLTVSGNATSEEASGEGYFSVAFNGGAVDTTKSTEGVSGNFNATGTRTATFDLTGFKEVGDTAVVNLKIKNSSEDLDAILNGSAVAIDPTVSGDTSYFTVSQATLDTTRIAYNEEATLTLTVKLDKPSVSGKTIKLSVSFSAEASDPQ